MIIKCIENKHSLISIQKYTDIAETEYILVGKEYVVYGFCQFGNYIEFCVYEDTICSFPIWCLYPFFEIINPLASRYWLCSIKEDYNDKKGMVIGFPEMIRDDSFYNNLTDGEEEEVRIFRYWKALMDLEFPINVIKQKAQFGDEKWFMCPSCIDAWEDSDNRDAMFICPMCKQLFHYPRYRSPIEASL